MKAILLYIILVMLAVACSTSAPKEEQKVEIENTITLNQTQINNIGIVYSSVEKRTLSQTLHVNGKIEVPPQNMVSISAQLGGYLKSTQLLPGMKVKKGEIIAVMEDQQYIQLQQDYLSAKAMLNYSKSEYERQKELNANKASSDKVYQQAEAEYAMNKIKIKSLEEKLQLITINPASLNETNISRNVNIYAPIEGYVSAVNVNIGKYVNPSDVLFELVNPSDIHLNLTVFEKDINKLFIGQQLQAYNNQSATKHNCEIILIGQNLSAERNVEVHCHFQEYDKALLPGMYMNADIAVNTENTYCLPSDAIVSYEGKDFIFIAETSSTFKMQEIKTGITQDAYTEVKDLQPVILAKKIVTKGAYSLLMSLMNKAEG